MEKLPHITYPDLPVARERDQILAALADHQVVVIVGDTGSGKTTQLPKMALEHAAQRGIKRGKVGCTQPRRIAAASVAKRVAEEMKTSVGDVVGFQVRFQDQSSRNTQLKFMTDGILLAETQGNADLRQYHTLIIDEAHERSLNIDFLLGYLKRLLPKRRDLKVIVSSATLDAESFSEFFDDCPVIQVEGRTFPVELEYAPRNDDEDLPRHVARAVEIITRNDDRGDILVFLPGEREIRECTDVLEGRSYRDTDVCPLFARLGLADQQRIFSPSAGRRRVVLATNVAETSLTIPGIVYVVDSGLARMSRWNPERGIQRLQIENVSQASANQRKGRCGRVSEGVCVRLYDEENFDGRPEFTDPEIRRSSLAGVILRMKSLGLPDISDFPFIAPPKHKNIAEGYRTLKEIQALDKNKQLTAIGRDLARLPVEPRLGRMLLEAEERNCLGTMLIIVSGLTVMDPRERPAEKAKEADAVHAKWVDIASDFLSYLHLWADLSEFHDRKGWRRNQLRKFCKKNFVNYRRVLEWDNLRRELGSLGRHQLKWKWKDFKSHEIDNAEYQTLHECLLAGMPKQFGIIDLETKDYKMAGGSKFAIFPGSGLFGKKKPEFLLAYEMVDTTRLWARRVARFDPAWIENVAPHLCRYRYHSASWDRKQGAVYAKETVSCGGIQLTEDRSVHFGRIDPASAREIFIREGLLADGMIKKPAFLKRIEEIRTDVERLEQKTRRFGGLWHEDTVYDFLDQKIPAEMCTAKAFHRWITGTANAEALMPELSDITGELPEFEAHEFPDFLIHENEKFPLHYHYAPAELDDGVTIEIALSQWHAFPDWLPTWGVWGDLNERVTALIRSLPKELRVACQPVAETVQSFVDAWSDWHPETDLYSALSEFLIEQTNKQDITPDSFELARLPAHLVTKLWIYDDETGEEIAIGENVAKLRAQLKPAADVQFDRLVGDEWEMTGHVEWDFEELPESVDGGGRLGFPGLIDEGETVGLKLWLDEETAKHSHRRACGRLFLLNQQDLKKLFEKKPPMAIETRMTLPLLGPGGVSNDEIALLASVQALGGPMPRDASAFVQSADQARGTFYQHAAKIGQILDEMVTSFSRINRFLEANRGDQNLQESITDMDRQIAWLLRADFLLQAGQAWLPVYPRFFKGIEERTQRLDAQPLIRDLDKIDRVDPFINQLSNALSEGISPAIICEMAYKLEELRVSIFAPNSAAGLKTSEKKLSNLFRENL